MFLISEIFHLHCQADWWRSVDGLTNQATGKLLIKSLCLFGQNLIDKLVYLQFFVLMVFLTLCQTLFSHFSVLLHISCFPSWPSGRSSLLLTHYSEIKLTHFFAISKTQTGTLVDITADLIKAMRQDHIMVLSALTPPYNPKSILPSRKHNGVCLTRSMLSGKHSSR